MDDLEGFIETDEVYQEDMKDFNDEIRIQWNICGTLGYQINRSIGSFENQILSYKSFKPFIDRASYIFKLNDYPYS